MSTELQAISRANGKQVVVESESSNLGRLAAQANQEHRCAEAAIDTMLGHAIRAGQALIEAQQIVGPDAWFDWLADNFNGSRMRAFLYVRLAQHQALGGDDGGEPNIARARRLLEATATFGQKQAAVARRKEAKRLMDSGLTAEQVAEVFGSSASTVRTWVLPASEQRALARKRKADRRRARQALEREQRKRDGAAIKGDMARAYSLARQLAQVLDRSSCDVEGEARGALVSAYRRVLLAEEDIGTALRIGAK